MRKLGNDIQIAIAQLSGDQEQARINLRANQVRARYRDVIQSVYRSTADLFLQHTNNVYIMNKKGARTLIVYVDESIFAAELNAQRELIKLKLKQLFGEQVEQFEIYVSRGNYKDNHPFVAQDDDVKLSKVLPIPLNSTEKSYVESTVSNVEPPRLKKSLEKAMSASLALNKAEKGKTS